VYDDTTKTNNCQDLQFETFNAIMFYVSGA